MGNIDELDLFCPHLNFRQSFEKNRFPSTTTINSKLTSTTNSSSSLTNSTNIASSTSTTSTATVNEDETVLNESISINHLKEREECTLCLHLHDENHDVHDTEDENESTDSTATVTTIISSSEAQPSTNSNSNSKKKRSKNQPLLWKCLDLKCGLFFCGSKGKNHAQDHYHKYPNHMIQENSLSKRVWCNECNHEVFLDWRNRRKPPAIWFPPLETEEYPPKGLYNIGNTCFLGAALQTMVSVMPLSSYLNGACTSLVGKNIAGSFLWLLSEVWQTDQREPMYQKGVIPSRLLHSIRTAHPIFRGFQQHDTQEFLRLFMDSLAEETKIPHFNLEDKVIEEKKKKKPIIKDKGNNDQDGKMNDDYDESESSASSETESFETCDSGNASEETMSIEQNGSGDKKDDISLQQQQSQKEVKITYKSIVSDIFDGQVESSVQCLSCKEVSRRLEVFQDLSLPIPTKEELSALKASPRFDNSSQMMTVPTNGWFDWFWDMMRSYFWGPSPSLQDCFSAFFSSDELKGKNMYSCEKCKKLRNGVKQCTLYKLPEVLCVHLKRFRMYEFSGGIGLTSKISQYVQFPLEDLDLKPYLHRDCKNEVTTYRLQGAICHLGSFLGGHYIAYIRKGEQWYLCDDSRVVQVTPEAVMESEAYVLFYQKWKDDDDEEKTEFIQLWNESERKILENSNMDEEDDRFHLISRKWLTMFFWGEESVQLDNSDVVCPHGCLTPNENLHLGATWIPHKLWQFIMKKYGGGPDLVNFSECSICMQALKKHQKSLKTTRSNSNSPSNSNHNNIKSYSYLQEPNQNQNNEDSS